MFWFELGPEGYSYGMGFWQAPAVTMAKFRARMDREPKACLLYTSILPLSYHPPL